MQDRIKALKRQWEREGRTCTYCGTELLWGTSGLEKSLEADHVIPVSLGGHVLGEMIPSCRLHNQRRQNKTVQEFMQLFEDERSSKRFKSIKGKGTNVPKNIPEVKRPLLW
ncbi:HNH endonuclease [Kocuria dechangensis]|uniref:HNH endonuclease n=1 Tax=Kocuria dechangensis TaxID=1176249 RepID=UPI001665A95D|nr:hypothetical protein [Kocuria dechangensis]